LGDFKLSLLAGIDMINEETRPHFPPGPGLTVPYQYRSSFHEYEKFSPDKNWMPSLVLIAKMPLSGYTSFQELTQERYPAWIRFPRKSS